MSHETIARNALNHYRPDAIATTPVDTDSIMVYPIPKAWTLDGFRVIRQLYPA